MFSEIKKRYRFLNKNLYRSNKYNLLRENTLAKYNSANVTKVLEHSLELDENTDTSILKAVDFYVENLQKNPLKTKRNESIVLEYLSKVRNAKQFRDSLKCRFGIHKNKAKKVINKIVDHMDALKTDTSNDNGEDAVQEFYSKALNEMNLICTMDRIIRNYSEISKRFNIDNIICENVTNPSKVRRAVITLCEFVETYKLTNLQKVQIALESSLWGLAKNGCPFDQSVVIKTVLEFFDVNENITREQAKSCIEKFNIYEPRYFSENKIETLINNSLIYPPKKNFNLLTPREVFKLKVRSFINSKEYTPENYFDLMQTIYENCGAELTVSLFRICYHLIDYIVVYNGEYVKESYIESLFNWLKEFYSLEGKDNTLRILEIIKNETQLDEETVYNFTISKCEELLDLINKDSEGTPMSKLEEGALIGKLDAVIDKFKDTISSLSEKERTASATFDSLIESIKKAIMDVGDQESREDVIADRYIPRASRLVKLTLALGLGYMIAPTLSVIGLFFYIAKTIATRTDERRKILNELDVEIEMCNKYIKQADEKDDFEKMRKYKLILKKLLDTRERVKSLMASKGENIYPVANKDED